MFVKRQRGANFLWAFGTVHAEEAQYSVKQEKALQIGGKNENKIPKEEEGGGVKCLLDVKEEEVLLISDDDEDVKEEAIAIGGDCNGDDDAASENLMVQESTMKVQDWLGKMSTFKDSLSVCSEPLDKNADALFDDGMSNTSNFSQYKRCKPKLHSRKSPDDSSTTVPVQKLYSFPIDGGESLEILDGSLVKQDSRREPPWEVLKLKHFYNVTITDFHGTEFFVQLEDEKPREQLKLRLRNIKRLTPLTDEELEPGNEGRYCLVESSGKFHRAMLQFSCPDSIMCFSVDTGELFLHDNDAYTKPPIYKMSSKIRRTLPFQVIRCKFFNLDIRNNAHWISYINSRYIRTIRKPQIYIMRINETSEENEDPLKCMDEYEIILYDTADDRNINELLVKHSLATKNGK